MELEARLGYNKTLISKNKQVKSTTTSTISNDKTKLPTTNKEKLNQIQNPVRKSWTVTIKQEELALQGVREEALKVFLFYLDLEAGFCFEESQH